MQRDRDERDRDRFPPPLERPLHRSSSFLHGLPPPIPASPRGYYPSSPNVRDVRDMPGSSGGGLTDPQGWSSSTNGAGMSPSVAASPPVGGGQGDHRPSSSRRWSPSRSGMSPRFSDRLPSLSDYTPGLNTAQLKQHPWESGAPPSTASYTKSGDPPFRTPGAKDSAANPADLSHESSTSGSTPNAFPSSSASMRTSNGGSKHANGGDTPSSEPPKKKKRAGILLRRVCEAQAEMQSRDTLPALPESERSSSTETSEAVITRGGKATDDRPTTATAATSITMSTRVAKLEKIVNAVLSKVPNVDSEVLEEWRQLHPGTSPTPQRPSLSTQQGDSNSTLSIQSTQSNDETWVGGLDRGTRSRNPLPQNDGRRVSVQLGLNYHGTVGEQLEKVVAEGASAALHKPIEDLPRRECAEKFVNFFFEKVNHVRYPIDQRLFRRSFEAVYDSAGEITPISVQALPVIFAVLAITMRLAPPDWAGGKEAAEKESLKFFWGAQFGIMVSTSVNPENLHLVEARLLLGLYLVLMHERRLAEGWLMFRAAINTGLAIGLHRDGTRLRLDPYMTEYRRRLWSYLCHADAVYSCLLGRPTMVDTMYYDTLPPSNNNLQDFLKGEEYHVPKPLTETTFATFLILRRRLAGIIVQIVRNFQKLQVRTRYHEVQAIHAELVRLRDDLPPQLRLVDPDKSQDHKYWYLPVHRFYIQTEILHFTIILHRPWFLRNIRSDRFSLSRRACFEAAVTDFKIRQAFHSDTPDFFETLRGGSFRTFNTAMIAGIALLLEPESARADDMWNILNSFMEHQADAKDDFSEKEASIISMLHKRAAALSKASSQSSIPTPSHPLQDNTSYERGGDVRPGSAAGSNPTAPPAVVDPTQGLQTPASESSGSPDDQVQTLFDQFLAANSEFGPNGAKSSAQYSAEYAHLNSGSSSLGMMGVGPPAAMATVTNPTANNDVDSKNWHKQLDIHQGGLPDAFPTPKPDYADVNTIQYWTTLVDAMFEQKALT